MLKKIIIFLFILTDVMISKSLILQCYDNISNNTQFLNNDFADNRVIVVMKNDIVTKNKKFSVSDFDDIECETVKEISNFDKNLNNQRSLNSSKILLVEFQKNEYNNVRNVIETLENRSDVLYVEPDYKVTLNLDEIVENNNLDDRNWAVESLSLEKCWNITTGISEVTVGVIDTGIDKTHPDLADSIDETLSKDFTSENNSNVGSFNDNVGHGTKVAGVISANYNELSTVGGVCPNISLVSLKAFDSDTTYSSVVLEAIDYASDNNINILNLSAGWKSYSDFYNRSIEEAIANFDGLFVCTAGNNNEDIDNGFTFYPACYQLDNIICVGALGKDDLRYVYNENNVIKGSSYGLQSVDIYAPGEAIYTTKSGGGYEYGRNTSMAAPFVTGVAAMLLSINITLQSNELKQLILDNAIEIQDGLDYRAITPRPNFIKKINPFGSLIDVMETEHTVLNLNDNLSYSSEISSDSTDYNVRNIFVKLNVVSANLYDANITGSNKLSFTLYDSSFNRLDIHTHSLNNDTTTKALLALNEETYYIKVNYENSTNTGLITINFSSHVHNYDCKYQWNDVNTHKKMCCCNSYVNEGHAVLKGTNKCILCNGTANTGFIGVKLFNSEKVFLTPNGSYVLPNGIIVLDENDIEAYFTEQLTFSYNSRILLK